jgi:hypothetical protein
MAAEGTSIDALETGDISAAADSAKMAQIMAEMNASGGAVDMGMPPAPPQPMGPMPSMPSMQHMMMPPPQYRGPPPNYVAVEEPVDYTPSASRKRNMWSSITHNLQGPILFSVLFFLLSLPMLHTVAAKYASWAFAVGGQFSWLGLAAFSLLGGLLFGVVGGVGRLLGF